MNVDLEKTFSFSCMIDDQGSAPWINVYDVRLRMKIMSEDPKQYNIAYERMKLWFSSIMQDSVLIDHNTKRSTAWKDTGMRCIDFPIYPVDQVIGLMLMSKLSAITEGRVVIQQIGISSAADDFVMYFCDEHDDLCWFESAGWWNDSRPIYCNTSNRSRSAGKVISLSRIDDWKNHGLDWNLDDTACGNVSVMPGFDKDA